MKQETRAALEEAKSQLEQKEATKIAEKEAAKKAEEKEIADKKARKAALKEPILKELIDFKGVLPHELKSTYDGFKPFYTKTEEIKGGLARRVVGTKTEEYYLAITSSANIIILVKTTDEKGKKSSKEIQIEKIDELDIVVLETLTIEKIEEFEDLFNLNKHTYIYQ